MLMLCYWSEQSPADSSQTSTKGWQMAEERNLPELARWLREIELEPGSERLQAINSAAFSTAEGLRGFAFLDMVLLAHGQSQGEAYSTLVAAVQSLDSTFAPSADDLETRLAAGAVVAAGLSISEVTSLVAYGTLSARWLGLGSAIPDLGHL